MLPASTPTVLRGVDRAAFAAALGSRLRRALVPVDLTAVADLVRALHDGTPATRDELYWLARITLVRRYSELVPFDAVFAAVFADAVLPMDPNARRRPRLPDRRPGDAYVGVPRVDGDVESGAGLPWATLPTVTGPADAAGDTITIPQRLPGELAGSPELPFEDLSERELDLLGSALAEQARRPMRRSRRWAIDAAGHRIALRHTTAAARRTGFEAVRLVTSSPALRPRRVVVLCDVSQSMQAQATAYLHLMRALVLAWSAEVFAFATRPTRLTPALSHRGIDAAVTAATTAVDDRFGGTKIARSIEDLLSGRHGASLRGAVVLVGSDGWDSDPPEQLGRAMARLHRRAHRVVWMNPRAGVPGFAPTVASMAAALPFCDDFLPAGTFAALSRVIRALAAARREPRHRPGGVNSTRSRGSTAGSGRP